MAKKRTAGRRTSDVGRRKKTTGRQTSVVGRRKPRNAAKQAAHDEPVNYGSYLALDKLLALQHPRSTPEHGDELMFIVVHQASELWFKVLLKDLDTLVHALESHNGGLALFQLTRINGLMRIVSAQLASLALLPPQRFAAFRANLGTSSGSQSVQFRALEAASGLREQWFLDLLTADGTPAPEITRWLERLPLQDLFLRFLVAEGVSLEQLYLGAGPTIPFFVAEALLEYEMEFAQWRFKHAQLVERMLGPGTTGTGGSQGAAFLHRTTGIRFFPKLAEVRAKFFG